MSIYCVGFLTDPHIPFHSRRGLDLAMQVYANTPGGIKALYLGGDVLDMYWCHGHGAKHPKIMSSFEHERDEGNKFLDMLDKYFPRIPKHFIEGNHETRFERWLVNNAPALFGITDMRLLLNMDKRKNWKYYDYGPNQLVQIEKTSLYAKHAPKGSSGQQILNQASCNLIFGHIHRIVQERKMTAHKKLLTAVSPGWLGDQRMDKVFGYVPGHHNWQTGFGRIWIDSKTNHFWTEVTEIKDGKCIADGKMYR